MKKVLYRSFRLGIVLMIFVLLIACRNQTVKVNKTLYGMSDNWRVLYQIEGKVKYGSGVRSNNEFTIGENIEISLEYIGSLNSDTEMMNIEIKRLFDETLLLRRVDEEGHIYRTTEKPDADILKMFENNSAYIVLIQWEDESLKKEFIILR